MAKAIRKSPTVRRMVRDEHTTSPTGDGPVVHRLTWTTSSLGYPTKYEVRCQWCHSVFGPWIAGADAQWVADNHRRQCERRPEGAPSTPPG